MTADITYCASSFLMFRRIADATKSFAGKLTPNFPDMSFPRTGVFDSQELASILKSQMEEAIKDGKAALALSGGIDSAILAKFMKTGGGGIAYTFRCLVPGTEVTNEVPQAAKYADNCGLKQVVVPVYWEDFEKYAPILMEHKGAPIHSIEVQIYKAALQAKADGFERLIFGESADCLFGGQSNLLSKDWRIGEFIDRYSYVMPYKVLKESTLVLEPYFRHEHDGFIDPHEFLSTEFFPESISSYINACETAGIDIELPYAKCFMALPLDYQRIRSGEGKYLVREIFQSLFADFEIPPKTPMPRPMNEWLKNWAGPTRPEFWPHCTDHMTGDQKWLVWCLEKFFDLLDSC